MRKVIIELNRIYGVENNAKITHFVNDQFATLADCEGVEFSLRDVEEGLIITAVKELIDEFQLAVDELINGVLLIPAMNRSKTSFSVVTEFRPCFIKALFETGFSNDASLVKEGQEFEYYGKDRHVVMTNSQRTNNNVIAGYLNGTLAAGANISVFMDMEELAGVKESYTKIKYNGSYPIYSDIWDEILMSSVYRRFRTEPMMELVLMACGDNAERISRVLDHGSDSFIKDEFESDVILSSWGKPIAKKITLFKAGDEKRLLNEQNETLARIGKKPVQLSIVSNCSKSTSTTQAPASVAAATEQEDAVQTEWGAF